MGMNPDGPLRRVAPRRGGPGGPGGGGHLPDVVELRRAMTVVSEELSKGVHYPVVQLQLAVAGLVEREVAREAREVAREAREVAREARAVARDARMETTGRNTTARFYNLTAVKLADRLLPLYSQISDAMADLQINTPIRDFPATVGDLAAVDPGTARLILRALEWPIDGQDDLRLKIELRKAIGVGSGFEG